MGTGKGKAVLDKTFADLVQYTVSHFAFESRLMARIGYAAMADHEEEHRKLIASLTELQARHMAGAAMVTTQVMKFLRDWLLDHIDASDRKLGTALNDKGVR